MTDASGYRDEAFSAQRRVSQLEAALGPAAPPPRRPAARVTVERVFVLLAVTMIGLTIGFVAAVIFAARAGTLDTSYEKAPPKPPTPAPPRAMLGWYQPEPVWSSHLGPWSVEADGETLHVGMLWLRGARELGLHVAAFDDATLKPRWIAGPYPSVATFGSSDRHALVVVRDSVVLTDADGTVRTLDLRTGEEKASAALRHGTRGACIDAQARVVVGFGAFIEPNTTAALFPWSATTPSHSSSMSER